MKKIISITLICVAASVLTAGCMKNADYYYLSAVSLNSEMGSIQGAGSYSAGTTATLQATPADGCYFVGWVEGEGVSDQDNIEDIITSWDNPYEISVNSTASYTAIFRRWGDAECSVQFGEYKWDKVYPNLQCDSYSTISINVQGYIFSKTGYGHEYDVSTYPIVRIRYLNNLSRGVRQLGHDDLYNGRYPRLYYCQNTYTENIDFQMVGSYGDLGEKSTKVVEPYGDWWVKSAKVVIYGFDSEKHKVSMKVEAEMYDAVAVKNGASVEDAETCMLTFRLLNLGM